MGEKMTKPSSKRFRPSRFSEILVPLLLVVILLALLATILLILVSLF
jgi:hypothetical protein